MSFRCSICQESHPKPINFAQARQIGVPLSVEKPTTSATPRKLVTMRWAKRRFVDEPARQEIAKEQEVCDLCFYEITTQAFSSFDDQPGGKA